MAIQRTFPKVICWLGAALLQLACASSVWASEIVSADFDTILKGRNHGETVHWVYSGNPEIYLFDFPSLIQQGRTFNRAMNLVEQFNEPYKRVLTVDEMRKYLEAIRRNQANFAYGHDFLVSELVLFFNLASRDKIELFQEEVALRDFLLEQRMMENWRGIYRAMKPDVVLLSLPQIQEPRGEEPKVNIFARHAILKHELAHAEFYTNHYYADYCRKFWSDKLNDAQREAFQKFLSGYNYSVNQQDLLVNEMQAYLMFTPDPNSFSAAKLGVPDEELEGMRELFLRGKPPTKLPM